MVLCLFPGPVANFVGLSMYRSDGLMFLVARTVRLSSWKYLVNYGLVNLIAVSRFGSWNCVRRDVHRDISTWAACWEHHTTVDFIEFGHSFRCCGFLGWFWSPSNSISLVSEQHELTANFGTEYYRQLPDLWSLVCRYLSPHSHQLLSPNGFVAQSTPRSLGE